MTTGRLSKQKNQKVLIDAFNILDPEKFSLYIAGDGELKGELEAAIGEKKIIKLLGEIAPNEIYSYFNNSDLFVFPSNWETFGIAVVEAALSGLPVLSSDIPVMREVLKFEEIDCAIFLDQNNPAEIAKSIQKLYENEEVLLSLKNKSRLLAKKYDFNQMVDNYLKLLNEK